MAGLDTGCGPKQSWLNKTVYFSFAQTRLRGCRPKTGVGPTATGSQVPAVLSSQFLGLTSSLRVPQWLLELSC